MAPRRTISPFQKALEPGSQDSLRPAKKGRPRTAPPPLPPTPHPRNEEDIIGQLEALGHTWAQKFVIQFGAELVNIALDELADKQGLKNQVGWIVFRVRELAQGAPPLGKAPKPDKSLAYLEEYQRRRGNCLGRRLCRQKGELNHGTMADLSRMPRREVQRSLPLLSRPESRDRG